MKHAVWLLVACMTGCECAPVNPDSPVDARVVDQGDASAVDANAVDAGHVTRVSGTPALMGMPVFRAPVDRRDQISSTFGPRWKISASRTDFHPAIDFFGDIGTPVVAIGEGVVDATYPDGSSDFPNGGNVVVVLHTLATPVLFHGQSLTRLYALYHHLDTIGVSVGQHVMSGQQVGTLGQTGDANFPHLHFEMRIGAFCSFQYQSSHPGTMCGLGFDPHVHPFLFIDGPNDDAIRLEEVAASPGDACTLRYTATRGDLDLDVIDTNLGTIGFNERRGMDASALGRLDDFRFGWMTIETLPFASASTELEWRLHFPTCPAYVELRDIHGEGIRWTR